MEITEGFYRHIGSETFTTYPKVKVEALENVQNEVKHKIKDVLGINVTVTLLAPKTAPRSEGGKLSRLVDKREMA